MSEEIKIVPDVPRETLHFSLPTVEVPMAAPALSPAPAATLTLPLSPSFFATSGKTVPIDS